MLVFYCSILDRHANACTELITYTQARERGNMSIRLLSRTDCILLPEADMLLEVGDPVAIIDFRVFVPEVFSTSLCVNCIPLSPLHIVLCSHLTLHVHCV